MQNLELGQYTEADAQRANKMDNFIGWFSAAMIVGLLVAVACGKL